MDQVRRKTIIYFDSAASSYHKPECVKQAVYDSFSILGNAGRGAHEPTLQASRLLYRTREKIARFFHAKDAMHVVFTSNVTEALNIVIHGLLTPEDHVITSICEHNSVLRPLYRKEKEGCQISFVRPNDQGYLTEEEIKPVIQTNTKLFLLHHASNVTGNVLSLPAISKLAHEHGCFLLVDAAQTAGSIPIDMEEMGIDILCFTGHKGLMGPQGTGGICIREGIEIPSYNIGGSGIQSFSKEHPALLPLALEAGTANGHGIAGLEAAIDFINTIGLETIHEKEWNLRAHFLKGLREIEENYPGSIKIYGHPEEKKNVSIVSLNLADLDSSYVADLLWEDYGICTRAGAHCAPRMHEFLGTKEQGVVRFSFSFFNTLEEVNLAVQALKEIVECELESPI